MLWRANQNYRFYLPEQCQYCRRTKERLFYFLGTRVTILLAQLSRFQQSYFCLTERWVPRGDGFLNPSLHEAASPQPQMQSKRQTQAEGPETKPMEQMESNSLTEDTVIPTRPGTYLKARCRLMESFEKHFICLETILVWHCFCFPSHPKGFWTTPWKFIYYSSIKSRLTTLLALWRWYS